MLSAVTPVARKDILAFGSMLFVVIPVACKDILEFDSALFVVTPVARKDMLVHTQATIPISAMVTLCTSSPRQQRLKSRWDSVHHLHILRLSGGQCPEDNEETRAGQQFHLVNAVRKDIRCW